jgi:pimeloyl-CoA synthetase
MKLNAIPVDTVIDAAVKQIEILRRLNTAQRADMTFQLSDNLRQIVEAGVRQRHPDWDDRAVKRGVLHLTIDERLFREIFADAGAS